MRLQYFLGVLLAGVLMACSGSGPDASPLTGSSTPPAQDSPAYDYEDTAAGQTVYVPVYSHVYQDRKRTPFNLVATLSVRNTDLEHPIRLISVRYYTSQGKLLRNYLDEPLSLPPLAATDFVVDEHDPNGSSTNFIVEWVAEVDVHEPVVEAVMISTMLSQGLSFTSPGRVIRSLHNHVATTP
jgi:hypothetical protein